MNRHALLEKIATYYNANGITLTDEQKTSSRAKTMSMKMKECQRSEESKKLKAQMKTSIKAVEARRAKVEEAPRVTQRGMICRPRRS